MLEKLISTKDSLDAFIIRLTVSIVILPHGLQKLLGVFGGGGFTTTIEAFEKWFGMPVFVTVLVIFGESFGMLALILGLFTRFMAVSLILIMMGAITYVTGKWGFFMNWYSQERGEGFEFHILVIGMALMLVFSGGGKWSLDQLLTKKLIQK